MPVDARSVDILLTSTRIAGSYNDGYADNLSFSLQTAIPTTTEVPPTTEVPTTTVIPTTNETPTTENIPEPTLLTLLGAGLVMAGRRLRSRRG